MTIVASVARQLSLHYGKTIEYAYQRLIKSDLEPSKEVLQSFLRD